VIGHKHKYDTGQGQPGEPEWPHGVESSKALAWGGPPGIRGWGGTQKTEKGIRLISYDSISIITCSTKTKERVISQI